VTFFSRCVVFLALQFVNSIRSPVSLNEKVASSKVVGIFSSYTTGRVVW